MLQAPYTSRTEAFLGQAIGPLHPYACFDIVVIFDLFSGVTFISSHLSPSYDCRAFCKDCLTEAKSDRQLTHLHRGSYAVLFCLLLDSPHFVDKLVQPYSSPPLLSLSKMGSPIECSWPAAGESTWSAPHVMGLFKVIWLGNLPVGAAGLSPLSSPAFHLLSMLSFCPSCSNTNCLPRSASFQFHP